MSRVVIKDREREAWVVVANFRVHLSVGFASSNKVSVRPRSNHIEWLTQCKNFYYCFKKKARLN